jgi:hypothetical protein
VTTQNGTFDRTRINLALEASIHIGLAILLATACLLILRPFVPLLTWGIIIAVSAVFAIEGEAGLRVYYCTSCRGHLKTYNGQGSKILLPADGASLHLDLPVQDRSLRRLAASVCDL